MSSLLESLLSEANDEGTLVDQSGKPTGETKFSGEIDEDKNGLPSLEDEDSSDEDLEENLSMRRMGTLLATLEEGVTAEQLNETMNIIRLNKQAKTLNLAHRQALLMAKAKNDPLYAKYAKFNGLRLTIRDALFKKYGSKAQQRARQLMAGTAKPVAK